MATKNTITIGHTTQLNIVIYKNEPVLTFKMIDQAHARTSTTATFRFNDHKSRFTEGKHFHKVPYAQAAALQPYGVTVPPRGLTLITKRGYLLLVKSFTDDLAWEVQEQLVDYYFEGQGNDTTEQVPTISATQLQAIREEMINCTRYLKHKSASFAHTLYRQMKEELGYQKIELLPLSLFDEAIRWIRKHQPICHQVYNVTQYVEREFIRRIKDQDYEDMVDLPAGILESYRPSRLSIS